MKKMSFKIIYKVALLSCLMVVCSCKKMFDVEPKNQVDAENMYRNVYDANAAVIGIYGKFIRIADRYIVLNELRGDLVRPTTNADQFMRQLNEHNVSADNPWADPRPYYEIILNCNDVLKNFDIMLKDAKMTNAEYNERYSDVGAIRSFIYLQLGIHYGTIPYVTDALETVDALKDTSKFPMLNLDQLLDKLIAFMADTKRNLEPYSAAASVNASLNTTVDGYPTNLMFITKRMLLGDLYLWKGNYTEASRQYRLVCDMGLASTNLTLQFNMFKIVSDGNANLTVTYTTANDERTLLDSNTSGWRAMFALAQGTHAQCEWMWTMPFDKNFLPVNPFIDLFSNQGGKYQLTASQYSLDNWNAQTQNNAFPYDARGRMSVKTINGQPVIMKQLYYYLDGTTLIPANILQKQGRWLIYRGATAMLHFAEATLNDNQPKLAYAMTNVGLQTVYNGVWPGSGSVPADRTNIMQTFLPAPYDMDARNGETPYYRSPWYRTLGTRTRANLVPLDPSIINNKLALEDAIINEDALELAFEGNRWPDLVRVALRRKDPSFLAEKVYQKLLRDGNPNAAAVRAKLMTTSNWYLPFKL